MNLFSLQRLLLLSVLGAVSAMAQSTNDLPELIPPYAALPPTFWEQYGLTLVVGSLVCVVVVGATVWMISRPKPVPVLPPEVQARRALEALRAQPENGDLLSQVSQILRRYISAAFGLPAGELTTQELISAMTSNREFDGKLRQATSQFLEFCDSRKFAPRPATSLQSAVSLALALIEQGESVRTAQAHAANTPA